MPKDIQLNFTLEEYAERLGKTRGAMAASSCPAN